MKTGKNNNRKASTKVPAINSQHIIAYFLSSKAKIKISAAWTSLLFMLESLR